MKLRDKGMLAALLGTVALALYTYFSAEPEVAEPVMHQQKSAPPPAKPSTRHETGHSSAVIAIQVLKSRDAEEEKTAMLFSGKTQLAAAKKAPRPPPPPPPVAPPLPFIYLGAQTNDGKVKVYLGRGEEVFIVSEGSVFARDYKLKAVEPQTLTLLYLPLGQIQQLTTGASN